MLYRAPGLILCGEQSQALIPWTSNGLAQKKMERGEGLCPDLGRQLGNGSSKILLEVREIPETPNSCGPPNYHLANRGFSQVFEARIRQPLHLLLQDKLVGDAGHGV